MVRKKKKREEETVTFCYYCDRIFSDETTLIQHQKARHYKCSTCHKKLNTIQGLAIHCSQVHKINVEAVPNAMPGRDSVNVEIFGMAGVPEGAAPGVTVPVEDESDAKRAATGQGITTPSILAPGYPTPTARAAYPPQYSAPPPYGYPPAGMLPPGMPPPGYMHPGMPPHVYPPRPGQPPMSMPPMRPPPGMPLPGQTMPLQGPGGTSMPPQNGQPAYTLPGHTPTSAPGAGQPLFPIGGAPAAAGSLPPQPAGQPGGQPQAMGASPPGGSLFPINVQDVGTRPAIATHPGTAAQQPADLKSVAEASAATAGDADLVWQEENVSMEERRAQLSKYAPRQTQAQRPVEVGAPSVVTIANKG
ncbi:hypothetical protein WJX79_006103 [Trebouxia sp. C0005]